MKIPVGIPRLIPRTSNSPIIIALFPLTNRPGVCSLAIGASESAIGGYSPEERIASSELWNATTD